MSLTFTLDELLQPVADHAPAGENLEYDASFLALERAAAGSAERAIGEHLKAASEPDWKEVTELSLALLRRSKDLRVATHLTAAWSVSHGINGWCDGLKLIRGLLEHFWESVHPQLDSEDRNNPTSRINALLTLSNPQGLLGHLRSCLLIKSPQLGSYYLRDILIICGALKAVESKDKELSLPTETEINAACKEDNGVQLIPAFSALNEANKDACAISDLLYLHLGSIIPPLKELHDDLHVWQNFLEKKLPQEIFVSADAALQNDPDKGTDTICRPSMLTIVSAADVILVLDKICHYYTTHEPSSPVPILLKRARRLVGKDFVDLLKDLAPRGVDEMKFLMGKEQDE